METNKIIVMENSRTSWLEGNIGGVDNTNAEEESWSNLMRNKFEPVKEYKTNSLLLRLLNSERKSQKA